MRLGVDLRSYPGWWASGRPRAPTPSNLFSDFGPSSVSCRAAQHSSVQCNKPRWDKGGFTSTILSYSRTREFSLPGRLADGKKKCVDVPRCDTASRTDWLQLVRPGRSPGSKKGKTPIPQKLGCEALLFTTAASVARTLKWRKRNAQKRIRI